MTSKRYAAICNLKTFIMFLETTPPDKLVQIYKILMNDEIEEASVMAHARIRVELLKFAAEHLGASELDALEVTHGNAGND